MNYKIIGDNLPAVICTVESGETLITEKGAMSWMSPNMKMETSATGGIGKAFGRMFSGESMFQNRYTAQGGSGEIAFASSFPGSIRVFEIAPEKEIICQKSAFLASEASVELSVSFQRKLGSGLFGGEGFIMQRLSGHGTAFIEIDGSSYDIQTVPGLKNKILGGEGLFNTIITGPGKVILQTMPINQVAGAIQPFIITGK